MGIEIGRKAAVKRGQTFDGPGTSASASLVGLPGSEFGVWPEDPDIVPDWRLRAEERASKLGVRLPSYRTRRQFEALVARCEKRIRAQRKVPPAEAASRFAAYLRSSSRVSYNNEELADAYTRFCDDAEIEAPESFMRGQLKRLPGIRREIRPERRNGRLVREAVWVIEPQPARRVA